MAWVSPTGHYDEYNCWYNEGLAYDDDEGTRAHTNNYNLGLQLTHAALQCDKIRIMARRYITPSYYDPNVAVDVYYGGEWHEIYDGLITKDIWVEMPIGSTESVDAAKVRWMNNNDSFHLWEFDFNEVEAPPVVKTLVQAALISIPPLIVLPTLREILKLTGGY